MPYKAELEKRQTPACYDDTRKSKMANGPFVLQTAGQFVIDMLSSGFDKDIDYLFFLTLTLPPLLPTNLQV